ncbi:Armadillo [Artemisia annua]|uniref:Armadillo n=1 Tax=Artemisia annua TaxID=35608 RepID=A0A2U1KUM6_ARTAN|nr:Armadillo [Artemisia annua]
MNSVFSSFDALSAEFLGQSLRSFNTKSPSGTIIKDEQKKVKHETDRKQSVLNEYNGTGKTFTLRKLGKDDASERGIMVRALEDIISGASPAYDSVEISYLQVLLRFSRFTKSEAKDIWIDMAISDAFVFGFSLLMEMIKAGFEGVQAFLIERPHYLISSRALKSFINSWDGPGDDETENGVKLRAAFKVSSYVMKTVCQYTIIINNYKTAPYQTRVTPKSNPSLIFYTNYTIQHSIYFANKMITKWPMDQAFSSKGTLFTKTLNETHKLRVRIAEIETATRKS